MTRSSNYRHPNVGELTGSITGQVFSYGYAIHDGICVYLNFARPRMAVEAIRAKLSKGDTVTVVPSNSDFDGESDDEAAAKLSPEEHLLRDLVNLAVTICDDGQVNPMTVIDNSEGATRLFRIEMGERRY